MPPIPPDEEERLRALAEAELLDTEPEADYDEIVRLTAELCETPISTVSLVDRDRQWFKARIGLNIQETPRSEAFCAHAILQEDIFVVDDARDDERFRDLNAVTGELGIRFYAGIPIRSVEGHAIGMLCVMGPEPRTLSLRQKHALAVLGTHVARLVHLRQMQHAMRVLLQDNRRRTKTLEQLTASATRLLSVVAHDVRGPLTSIIGLLADDVDVEAMKDDLPWLLAEVRRQATAGRDLLDQILAWARTMLHGGPTVVDDVDPRNVLDDVTHALASVMQEKQLRLSVTGTTVPIATDPNVLRFILHTLVTNAIKFSESTSIDVDFDESTTSDGRRTLVVRVTDHGTGIPDRVRQHLFDWNRRSGTPGTRNERGAGLGLLLVRDFLDTVGGTIDVTSVVGSGTTMTVRIPAAPPTVALDKAV